jgi:hypothetical protein
MWDYSIRAKANDLPHVCLEVEQVLKLSAILETRFHSWVRIGFYYIDNLITVIINSQYDFILILNEGIIVGLS